VQSDRGENGQMKNHIDDKIDGINSEDYAQGEQSNIPSSPDQTDGAGNTREIIGTGKILPFQPDYRRKYSPKQTYHDTNAGEKILYWTGVIDGVTLVLLAYLIYKMIYK
jgi:hypothetical protein